MSTELGFLRMGKWELCVFFEKIRNMLQMSMYGTIDRTLAETLLSPSNVQFVPSISQLH